MGGVQSLVLLAWSSIGSQAIDKGAHPPGVSGVGAQTADWGTHLPGGLGLCAPAALLLIWVHTDLGFKCVLGLLIWCSQSRG